MPQSSYIVWDDSELGEAYCLDVFVVQVHCCGMWGFPPSWVFLDLCEFMGALHNAEQCAV